MFQQGWDMAEHLLTLHCGPEAAAPHWMGKRGRKSTLLLATSQDILCYRAPISLYPHEKSPRGEIMCKAMAVAIALLMVFVPQVSSQENLPPDAEANPGAVVKFPQGDLNARAKDLSTALHWAAVQGKPDEVNLLLSRGADCNVKDLHGWTPLHYAVVEGHKEVVALLLSNGADPDARDEDNCTPLDRAIESNHDEILELFIGGDTAVPLKNTRNDTVLHCAAAKGLRHSVELLLAQGADVNAANKCGETPLFEAVRNGHADVAQLLLSKRADANVTGPSGWTSLFWAVQRDDMKIVKLLLREGADVNAKNRAGHTPCDLAVTRGNEEVAELLKTTALPVQAAGALPTLHEAARDGQLDVVTDLLAQGADVNAKDPSGATALHYSAMRGHEEIAKVLLANGADVNSTDEANRTALDFATTARQPKIVEMLLAEEGVKIDVRDGRVLLGQAVDGGYSRLVQLLLDKFPDLVNGRNRYGETLLHNAARAGNRGLVQLLLEGGSDVNAADNNGSTALHFVAMQGRKDIAELLIDRGADVTVTDGVGAVPLRYAMQQDNMDIIELLLGQGSEIEETHRAILMRYAAIHGRTTLAVALLNQGVDIYAQDEDGRTPLHEAASRGHTDITKLLLAWGADTAARDKDGATPLHYAVRAGHEDVVRLLLAWRADIGTEDKNGISPVGENPDLLMKCASTGQQAYEIWQAVSDAGTLDNKKDFDPISRRAASLIQEDIKNQRGGVTVAELRAMWDAAEKRRVPDMAAIRYVGLVGIGDWKGALAQAREMQDLKLQTECEITLRLRADAIRHAVAVVHNNERENIEWWVGILDALDPSREEFADLLSQCCQSGTTAARYALLARMKRLGVAGRPDEFLRAARIAYEVWPYEDLDTIITEIGKCQRALGNQGMNFYQFLRFQRSGNTGKAGDPWHDVPRELPDSVRLALSERLKALIPTGDQESVYRTFVQRGEVYQFLGSNDDALRAYRTAYAIAPIELVDEASMLIPRVLKARDHHLVNASAYSEFQRFGPPGPDGIFGTPDDLNNPLGRIPLKFPPDVEKALRNFTNAQRPDPLMQAELRAMGYLALGDYAMGFQQFNGNTRTRSGGPMLTCKTHEAAVLIRAYDGHVYRVNQYLLCHSRGNTGSGEESKDLTDPLPAIWKELGL